MSVGGAVARRLVAQDRVRLCGRNAGDRANYLFSRDCVVRNVQWDNLEQLYVMFLR